MLNIKQGDCLKLMKEIPNKSVDMILCDLPYGKTKAKWDSVIPLDLLWKQYKRIIKEHGAIVLFGIEPFISKVRLSNLKMYRYDWIWKKRRPSGFLLSKKMPLRDFENISVFYRHLPTYNPQMRIGKTHTTAHGKVGAVLNDHSIFFSKKVTNAKARKTNEYYPVRVINFNNSNYKSLHPTQKPTDLLEYFIKTYTNKQDIVLDSCMGSGSTGIACINTDRNFIGHELNNHYFNVAKDRIDNHLKEGNKVD